MSEIERNGTFYRTCLKWGQYKYIGSISGIVYRFFSQKIYFLNQFFIDTLNSYSIHVHFLNIALRFYTGMFSRHNYLRVVL